MVATTTVVVVVYALVDVRTPELVVLAVVIVGTAATVDVDVPLDDIGAPPDGVPPQESMKAAATATQAFAIAG